MRRNSCRFLLFSAATMLAPLTPISLPAAESDLSHAMRVGDEPAVRTALQNPVGLVTRDADGNTPLHAAALRGDATAVAGLLKAGADVNVTNSSGATPLLYGVHNARVVRELLAHGANPNLASALGSTPLMAAVICRDSYAAVTALLAHGADVRARRSADRFGLMEGEQPLAHAIEGGDPRTIRLLIEHGASINPSNSFTPLQSAVTFGELGWVRRLLDLGADPNGNPDSDKVGHTLNSALYNDHRQVAALLIEHGADLHRPAPTLYGHATPPALFAAYNESGNPTIVRLLIARGIDVNTSNEAGATPLDWALRRGPGTPLVEFLRRAGANGPSVAARRKTVPQRDIPASPEGRQVLLRGAISRAIQTLQRSSDAFLESGVHREEGHCATCHQQYLPAAVLGLARERGYSPADAAVSKLLHAQSRFLSDSTEAARQLLEPVPDAANHLGWAMQGLRALNHAPDEMTEAMVSYLLIAQREDGSWRTYDRRPPIQDGPIVGTALAVRAVQSYPLPGRPRESRQCLKRARHWLARARPETQNERAFQLLGLGWSGETPSRLGARVEALLAEQRADGGWAQLPGLGSDAWATGQALVALHQAGEFGTSEPAYQRGVDFLLRSQFEDGSWWVRTRSWAFQPHFDSQFPHGKDQWISAAGTAWATMALLLTVEPGASTPSLPTAPQLPETDPARGSTSHAARVAETNVPPPSGDIDFVRDIRPIFERSCVDCHSGKKPKGGFDLSRREAALSVKGGQSAEPAIRPGQAEGSQILRLVSDKVEDLEMPPISKRTKYPALTKDEIERLRRWIDAGAIWPDGLSLEPADRRSPAAR